MRRREWMAMAAGVWMTRPSVLLGPATPSFQSWEGFRPPDEAVLHDLPRLLELAAVPGLAVALWRDRQVMWTGGYGITGGASSTGVGPDTVFEAASLTKPVFAALVLRLAEDGRLDLDRPLAEYLPAPYVADPRGAGLTARHVLRHASGFRNWRFGSDTTLTVDAAPGERFGYSGEGFYALQVVVETIMGQGVAALLRDRVLAPLSMTSTSLIWQDRMAPGLLAYGHRRTGQPHEPRTEQNGRQLQAIATRWGRPWETWRADDVVRAHQEMVPPLPTLPVFRSPNVAGSLLTTVTDYARFLGHQLGDVRGPLSGAARREMTTPQTDIRPGLGWGLGVGVERSRRGTFFWHWGDNPGFKNFVIGHVESRSGLVVLTNGDGGRPVYERLVRAAGHDPAAFLWLA